MARIFRRWLAVCFLATAAPNAYAVIVTLTMESLPSPIDENVVENGFRISVMCHGHAFSPSIIFVGLSYPYGDALSADNAGCFSGSGIFNEDYLGTNPGFGSASIYIDAFGQPFNFESFDQLGLGPAQVTSSKGGLEQLETFCIVGEQCPTLRHHELFGGDWNGVQWIQLEFGQAGVPVHFFDNLRFQIGAVPAPNTTALLLIGGAALTGMQLVRRRRRPLQTL